MLLWFFAFKSEAEEQQQQALFAAASFNESFKSNLEKVFVNCFIWLRAFREQIEYPREQIEYPREQIEYP